MCVTYAVQDKWLVEVTVSSVEYDVQPGADFVCFDDSLRRISEFGVNWDRNSRRRLMPVKSTSNLLLRLVCLKWQPHQTQPIGDRTRHSSHYKLLRWDPPKDSHSSLNSRQLSVIKLFQSLLLTPETYFHTITSTTSRSVWRPTSLGFILVTCSTLQHYWTLFDPATY